jgi:glycosyltransferase involved in cell wall biosynthesis
MARVLVIGGLAKSLVTFRGPLLLALQAAGHEVHTSSAPGDPATLAWLAARGIPFHPVALQRASLSPREDVATVLDLRRMIRRVRPDAVIGYTIKPVVYGTLAAWSAGVPGRHAMITGLGFAFTAGAPSLTRTVAKQFARLLYRVSLRRTASIIFQNPDDLAEFRDLRLLPDGVPTTIVNGSGVDVVAFAEAPLPAAPRILMVSRLVADKGIVEFIRAARAVKADRPEVSFTLVGPADPNPAALPAGLLEEAIRDGTVEYLGELHDVRPEIARCSIFALPSYREGTPRSVLEAMAMGRPIVTSDAPGCRETVVPGVNGLLVPVADVAALAEALHTLIADPELRARMGRQSRRIAVDRYEAGQVARSILVACRLDAPTAAAAVPTSAAPERNPLRADQLPL